MFTVLRYRKLVLSDLCSFIVIPAKWSAMHYLSNKYIRVTVAIPKLTFHGFPSESSRC